MVYISTYYIVCIISSLPYSVVLNTPSLSRPIKSSAASVNIFRAVSYVMTLAIHLIIALYGVFVLRTTNLLLLVY